MHTLIFADSMLFLSTLSLRRATRRGVILSLNTQFLSTLSLRRATILSAIVDVIGQISIHALLAESDTIPRGGHINKANFYPRSPCGERLVSQPMRGKTDEISIHALLAESDDGVDAFKRFFHYFYPRSPCGERRMYPSLPPVSR